MQKDNYIFLGSHTKFLTHTRYLFTLRSATRPSDYHTLLLFRLARLAGKEEDNNENSETGDHQFYVMESTCPHLGAPLSHAEIEECGMDVVAVCPWHRYDFDLRTGKSETGLNACTYSVDVRSADENGSTERTIWVQPPGEGPWEVVEVRPVSEEFADPPPEPVSSSADGAPIEIPSSLTEPVIPDPPPRTLLDWAVLILNTPNPELKVQRTRQAVSAFRTGKLKSIRSALAAPPDIPPREDLNIVQPGKVKKRGKAGSLKSQIAILHALANIEQWAIDLAWDMIARFGNSTVDGKPLPHQFFSDWTKVAEDEAKHFSLLRRRLQELGSFYGAHSVHAGLWESAQQTAHSLSSRLCIIHLVHEARGLDVNPTTIARFRTAGDTESVKVLEVIHHDEITHVTAGHRWFTWLCGITSRDPVQAFRQEVKDHFSGALKGPFNEEDRRKAGMTPDFYEDLRGEIEHGEVGREGNLEIGYEKEKPKAVS
ncbi:hypothetical protein BOTBODRAFT_141294 [Botryobasidium botryosum FD-172 SS1]|uniref:Rieske domain-containing protein n=1 Tax=Botryobasidium botryosum (strain FD-172 SS1) TaxID=930990 RepID=A0A067LV32_BOTB1|nr:hypothetical protein BOTBODRAFT_141294 [Botryobasidium botryosum FD-172 SS1]